MKLRRRLPSAGRCGHECQRAQEVRDSSILGRQQGQPCDDAQHDLISQGRAQAGEPGQDMLPAAQMGIYGHRSVEMSLRACQSCIHVAAGHASSMKHVVLTHPGASLVEISGSACRVLRSTIEADTAVVCCSS